MESNFFAVSRGKKVIWKKSFFPRFLSLPLLLVSLLLPLHCINRVEINIEAKCIELFSLLFFFNTFLLFISQNNVNNWWDFLISISCISVSVHTHVVLFWVHILLKRHKVKRFHNGTYCNWYTGRLSYQSSMISQAKLPGYVHIFTEYCLENFLESFLCVIFCFSCYSWLNRPMSYIFYVYIF